MAFDIIPSNFLTFPSRFHSLWEEDEDMSFTKNFVNGLSIAEDEKNVYVEAAIPGIDPKNVDITFDKGIVWIKAEQKTEETSKKYYKRAANSFSYRVAVPGEIDSTIDPVAEYKQGVMHISFAKSPKKQPKKIAIKTTEEN